MQQKASCFGCCFAIAISLTCMYSPLWLPNACYCNGRRNRLWLFPVIGMRVAFCYYLNIVLLSTLQLPLHREMVAHLVCNTFLFCPPSQSGGMEYLSYLIQSWTIVCVLGSISWGVDSRMYVTQQLLQPDLCEMNLVRLFQPSLT